MSSACRHETEIFGSMFRDVRGVDPISPIWIFVLVLFVVQRRYIGRRWGWIEVDLLHGSGDFVNTVDILLIARWVSFDILLGLFGILGDLSGSVCRGSSVYLLLLLLLLLFFPLPLALWLILNRWRTLSFPRLTPDILVSIDFELILASESNDA
jgi:hypothetical protein